MNIVDNITILNDFTLISALKKMDELKRKLLIIQDNDGNYINLISIEIFKEQLFPVLI